MTAKISLIIITRNRTEMLKRCLLSIVNQARVPDEVIVVDNASEDDTKKIILSFSKKLPIKYVYEKRVGIPYARNRGIKESHGSIILMTDDDCEADKDWVKGMIAAHIKYPKAWAIQGRTHSKPTTKIYSLFAEFSNFFYFCHNVKEQNLNMKEFFSQNFKDEFEFLSCDTKNFSIKTSYLKKNNLSFDEQFFIFQCGEDTDLGRQIIQKKGITMFCPLVTVYHWERPNLKEFLKQRFNRGRSAARATEKWQMLKPDTYYIKYNLSPEKILDFILFCKIFHQWHNLPKLLVLFLLDRIYRYSGFFYRKVVLA